MLKRISFFALVTAAFSYALFLGHLFVVGDEVQKMTFALKSVYLFNFISCLLICVIAELLNVKMPTQVGYAYLAAVFVKMGFFLLVFNKTIFSVTDFTMTARISMVVPTMLFLIIEATYCGRLMNKHFNK